MAVVVTDVIVDTLFEENLEGALQTLRAGRILSSKDDPDEPFLTQDGYLVVRVRNQDPIAFCRELERRVSNMRIVSVVDRTPKEFLETKGN